MPSILLSDNGVSSGSAGLKSTAASDGSLALQTTTAGGTATTAVTIDTSQNVGVGTASPSQRLHVVSSGTTPVNLVGATACQINLNDGTQNANWGLGVGGVGITGIASPSTYPLVLYTNGAERMRLDSSGNLGLGITPSAWAGGFTAIDIKYGGIAATISGSANTEVTHNAYYNGTNWIAKYTGGYGTRYGAGDGGHAWYTSSTTTTGGSTISFNQAMTLDTSGNLLQGTTSVGTMSGNTVHRLANTGIIARTSSSLASGSALNIVVSSGGASFAGFLVVENVVLSNALIRTQTTYSVFGRGTTFTATSIASSNGSSGAASFTVTCPSTGVISVTNTSGNTTGVNMSFFGSEGF